MVSKIIALCKYNALLEQNVMWKSKAFQYPAHSQGCVDSRTAVQTQSNKPGLS